MSIASEISRLSSNISDSLDAVAAKGVTVPSDSNSDDLPGLIALIEQSSGGDSGGTIYQDTDGYLHLSEDNKNVISIVDTLDTAGGTIRTIDAKVESGGTMATLIASGTYTGTGTYPSTAGQGFFVGTRMPQTDFYVRFIARSDSEFPYDTNYKFAYGIALVFSSIGHFDLSTVGDGKQMISDITYNINNEGTITAADAGMPILFIDSVRNATAKNTMIPNNYRIDRRSDGFYLRLFNSSPSSKYESGITYDWEVVYFGSNPSTDIVSIS